MIIVNDSYSEIEKKILLSYIIVLFRFAFHIDRAAGDCSGKGPRQFLCNEEEEDQEGETSIFDNLSLWNDGL